MGFRALGFLAICCSTSGPLSINAKFLIHHWQGASYEAMILENHDRPHTRTGHVSKIRRITNTGDI